MSPGAETPRAIAPRAAIPRERIPLSDPRLRGALSAAALVVAVGAIFLPGVLVNNDEIYYAGPARMLVAGHVAPVDGDPLPVQPGLEARAARCPLGWPLLLAPGAAIGPPAMWLLALLLHGAGGIAAGRMLARRGLPSWLAGAYLAHPVLWLYARTLMSDAPCVALLILGLDQIEQRRPGLAAISIGYTAAMRLAAPVVAAGVALALVCEGLAARRASAASGTPDDGAWRDPLRTAALVLAATAVFGALGAASTRLATGDWISPHYAGGSTSILGTAMLAENALLYLTALFLVPPFPLLGAALRPRDVDAWALAALPVVGFFVLYTFHDRSPRWAETFIGGQRLIVAAHAILIVGAARAWAGLLPRRLAGACLGGLGLTTIAAIAVCVLARPLAARNLPAAAALRACAPERIGFNHHAALVALSVPARAYHTRSDLALLPPVDVVLFSARPTSHTGATWDVADPPATLAARARSCRRVGAFLLFDLSGRCPASDTSAAEDCAGPSR